MKKNNLICLLIVAFAFIQFSADAQTANNAKVKTASDHASIQTSIGIVKEIKTTVGTFMLQSSDTQSNNEMQYSEKTITTSDGGTATLLVVQQADEINTGFPALPEQFEVTIYPNPFNTTATLEIEGIGDIGFVLYDVFGRVVKESVITDGTKQYLLERNNLAEGIYFFKITGENDIISRGKLIIN